MKLTEWTEYNRSLVLLEDRNTSFSREDNPVKEELEKFFKKSSAPSFSHFLSAFIDKKKNHKDIPDKIVRFHLERKIYNLNEINDSLPYYGIPLIGERTQENQGLGLLKVSRKGCFPRHLSSIEIKIM